MLGYSSLETLEKYIFLLHLYSDACRCTAYWMYYQPSMHTRIKWIVLQEEAHVMNIISRKQRKSTYTNKNVDPLTRDYMPYDYIPLKINLQ